jgi:hypothetical protein
LIDAIVLNGTSWDYATDLEIDDSNNIYISGFYFEKIDFDPSQEEYSLSAPEPMYFIAKYDSSFVLNGRKTFRRKRIIGDQYVPGCSQIITQIFI